MPGTGGAFTASTDAVTVSSTGTRPRGWTSDLFSSQLRPELGGALWSAGYTPGDRLTSWMYSTICCTVPVYKLLFIRQ
jgi:hypothetical protein